MPAPHNWIAVASAEHARRGRAHAPVGFMQLCHGRHAPLQRLQPGDRLAYYAPATTTRGADRLQSFVSIGVVQPGEPYAFDMGAGFAAWRRDIAYLPAREAPIAPLLDHFAFVTDRQHWGAPFRFGLFSIGDTDMRLVAEAMEADLAVLHL
ncbi:EVE domain-containing protein [Xylophilus sp. GW821-FHT01B05]